MPAAAAQDSLIGLTLLDRYRIIRQIGKGGMGVVYEAEHVELGNRVAVKLVLEKYADDGEALSRFKREALAASRIGNPHIIQVIEIGIAPDGRPFVIMELLSGAPLSKVLEASGQMPAWRAVPLMRQVLRAVAAAHAKGIIHRDLKPDNIFLLDTDDNHDFVKLLDFGISKIMSDSTPGAIPTRLTTTGVVMGTPLYMAPEQAMGTTVDQQADVYACGVIMYELLSGRPPFDATTYPVLIAQLLTAQPKSLAELMPGLPRSLIAAVHRALEKDPANRWPTADAFAAALGRERTPSQIELAGTLDSAKSLGMASTIATPGSGSSPVTPNVVATARDHSSSSGRRWFLLGGIALGAAIAVGGGVWISTRHHDDAPPPAVVAPTVTSIADAGAGTVLPTAGVLQVNSDPPGAEVTVDGIEEGKTPVDVTVAMGKHHLRLSLDGYATIELDQNVVEAKQAFVANLAPVAAGGASVKPPSTTTPHGSPHPPPPHGDPPHPPGSPLIVSPNQIPASPPPTPTPQLNPPPPFVHVRPDKPVDRLPPTQTPKQVDRLPPKSGDKPVEKTNPYQ